jgi:hypothetical protein
LLAHEAAALELATAGDDALTTDTPVHSNVKPLSTTTDFAATRARPEGIFMRRNASCPERTCAWKAFRGTAATFAEVVFGRT